MIKAKNITLVCNWKMNPKTREKAEKLFSQTKSVFAGTRGLSVIVCPPIAFLPLLKSNSKVVTIGAQNHSAYEEGAHTGEYSAQMIRSIGVTSVILGHSEIRAAGDTNELVNEKIKLAFKGGLMPILCIGEKKRDPEGFYLHELKEQITVALSGIPRAKLSTILFAYEPVWAIGQAATRQTTPEECLESIIFIKKIIADLYDPKVIEGMRFLYGGSVDEKNAELFIKFGGVSGLLIGRACLDPKKLSKIVSSLK